jgi:uncharacterized protein YciI
MNRCDQRRGDNDSRELLIDASVRELCSVIEVDQCGHAPATRRPGFLRNVEVAQAPQRSGREVIVAYMIYTRDRADGTPLRDTHRAEHYAYLRQHAHRLIASGGIQDEDRRYVGGMIVLDVDTLAEAEAFAAADPFTRAGLFEQVVITRWVQVFLNRREDREAVRVNESPGA